MTFTGTPGYSYSVKLQTNAIDATLPANKDYLNYLNSIDKGTATTIDFSLDIHLRECEVGE